MTRRVVLSAGCHALPIASCAFFIFGSDDGGSSRIRPEDRGRSAAWRLAPSKAGTFTAPKKLWAARDVVPAVHEFHSKALVASAAQACLKRSSRFNGCGPWRGFPRTSIWCLHDRVHAKSMRAMRRHCPAALRKLREGRSKYGPLR